MPTNGGRMCTLTSENVIPITCITTEEVNTNKCPHPHLHFPRPWIPQDLHFATNDICIATHLANVALKSTDDLMKRKHH